MPVFASRWWSLLTAVVLASCSAERPAPDDDDCGGKCDDGSHGFEHLGDLPDREFEYIVVGSGAGGGPLAANLARQGHSVLLLEAGREYGGKNYSVPAFHPNATETPGLAWWYWVEHYRDANRADHRDSKRTPEGILYPRGGTLGGSTAVNALITVAPSNSDWDRIAASTGDSSWSAGNMNRYLARVQRWLGVERPHIDLASKTDGSFIAMFVATFNVGAATGLGTPALSTALDPLNLIKTVVVIFEYLAKDINAALQQRDVEGVFQLPLATRDHKRNGTREYIVQTATDPRRFPLRVKTQALVTRVLFDAKESDGRVRATGVEFLDGASLYGAELDQAGGGSQPIRVRASREVILAAGAFNTPQLLMLSGIGARSELEALGVEVKVDLPAVGKNLQDRYEVGVVTELSRDYSALKNCTFGGDSQDKCFRDWQQGQGPYTSNGGLLSVLKRSGQTENPDLHMFVVPGVFKGYKPGYSTEGPADKHHATWVILKGHTRNTAGTVSLASADPRVRPRINFHYFDDGDPHAVDSDLAAVVDGIELARQIADRTDQLDVFATYNEVWPGRATSSRAALADWVKKEAWGHHASCSAPIGPVLDSGFRVHGTTRLRVVDASVFPNIPGTFIVLPTYMISEKAFDNILWDLGEHRRDENFP